MAKFKFLKASDGTGNAVLATISAPRSIGSTVIDVNTLAKWPQDFIVVTGTLDANGFITPASMTEMKAHQTAGDIIIDGFAPGYTDQGNTTGQVAVLKPTTHIQDLMYERVTPPGLISPYAGAAAPANWLLCDGALVSRTTYDDLFTAISTTFGVGDGSTTFGLPDLRSRIPVGVGAAAPTKIGTFVSRAGNVITISGLSNTALNEFQTGQAVVFNTTGTVIGGLTNATTYYIIRTGNLTFSLATTRANALLGTVITLSSDGTGTRTFTLSLTARTLAETGGEEEHSLHTNEMPSHRHEADAQTIRYVTTGGQFTPPGGVTQNTGAGLYSLYTGGSEDHNIMQPFVALNYIIKT